MGEVSLGGVSASEPCNPRVSPAAAATWVRGIMTGRAASDSTASIDTGGTRYRDETLDWSGIPGSTAVFVCVPLGPASTTALQSGIANGYSAGHAIDAPLSTNSVRGR